MNPYTELDDKSFWKKAVSEKSMFDIEDLWSPKFNISIKSKISTYGSCFAQHIGKSLRHHGYSWLITEKAPLGTSNEVAKQYSYNVFSARTGNIYTTSLLRQWVEWACCKVEIPAETWKIADRYYDPFRPAIEPTGFQSEEELKASREYAVKAFYKSIECSDFFVFTLGLTESWFNIQDGYEYPMCPGTVAGTFEDGKHHFVNQSYKDVITNLTKAIELMRQINPRLKFILTVSPVPLTATKSGKHVLLATTYSKSILRAVAGQLSNKKYIDYFPSYEIINSTPFKGVFFEPNMRNVNPKGVELVMEHFFSKISTQSNKMKKDTQAGAKDELICEEEILSSFGGQK